MISSLARKLFGSHNDRILRAQDSTIARINALEPSFIKLSDEELKAKTGEYKARLGKGETLDDLLPEAFATVRESAKRVLGQRHFDVQMRGGMVLHSGKISEMKTGEGKTLVATLAVYLNALSGKGVHVVTVNDYLAKRDSRWMGQVYGFLGLTTGCIIHGLSDEQRQAAYNADITYGTNNEFGFDYLRDNMKFDVKELCQRPFNYAIVDEVDSILIDEARTPLIISGAAEDSSDLYQKIDALIPQLNEADYEKDEKSKTCTLTEEGNVHIEELLGEAGLLTPGGGLYDAQNISVVHHVNQALRAHKMFQRDVDYIVKSDKVIIIDEFTGRMMDGRRYSDGLHQALEAKERVTIQRENQTLASITFQNYFRLYPKLAGMTGTAMTEAAEFAEIYNLETVEIPTNVPAARNDMEDEIYGTMAEKIDAIVLRIVACHLRGQPVLVGTTSIERSEQLSKFLGDKRALGRLGNSTKRTVESYITEQKKLLPALNKVLSSAGQPVLTEEFLLNPVSSTLGVISNFITETANSRFLELETKKAELICISEYLLKLSKETTSTKSGIPHNILNARHHEQEATIIAQAGRSGAVTIATNMAGRGTDIQMGGNLTMRIEQELADVTDEAERARQIEAIRADIAADGLKARNAGGLFVIGTERHESRRIDNQLRGRSGRQGDPGASMFYLSLEDDLMRIFGSERMEGVLTKLGLRGGEKIAHPWISTALEKAQQKVESKNFDIRKNLLKFDNVMNDQRKVIYEQRREIMVASSVSEDIKDMRHDVIHGLVTQAIPPHSYPEQWDLKGLKERAQAILALDLPIEDWGKEEGIAETEIEERLRKASDDKMAAKAAQIGLERMAMAEKAALLGLLDATWKDHLLTLDQLKQGIHLRSYGQRDPFNEYNREAFDLFQLMLDEVREKVTKTLSHAELRMPTLEEYVAMRQAQEMRELHGAAPEDLSPEQAAALEQRGGGAPIPFQRPVHHSFNPTDPSTWGNTPRNAPCPCGSGKKYKHCHGAVG